MLPEAVFFFRRWSLLSVKKTKGHIHCYDVFNEPVSHRVFVINQ